MKKVLFHGGCHGCSESKKGGTAKCPGCQFFRADWSLPDLNDHHVHAKQELEKVRRRLEAKS